MSDEPSKESKMMNKSENVNTSPQHSEPVNMNEQDEIDKLIAKYRMGFVVGDKDITTYYMDFKKELTTLLEQAEKRASKVDRIEVIDETGRAYVKGSIYGTPVNVELSYQDDNKTLKVFVSALEGDK